MPDGGDGPPRDTSSRVACARPVAAAGWTTAWTRDRVDYLIAHRVHERLDLEFKAAKPDAPAELARWIAAMANTGGGAIVFGVEEDAQGRAVRASPIGVPLAGATAFVERAACSLDELAVAACVEIQAEGSADGFGYVVVEVAPSRRTPHLLDGVAWMRADHGIRRMRRAELARSFARADGFMDESGLARSSRRPAAILVEIQRLGADRVLTLRNVGDRPAFGVRCSHLARRGVVTVAVDDPFPVEVMDPNAMVAVRTAIPPTELPAKIEVSWFDDRRVPRRTLAVVT
jgi:Putative DNA-binding domain